MDQREFLVTILPGGIQKSMEINLYQWGNQVLLLTARYILVRGLRWLKRSSLLFTLLCGLSKTSVFLYSSNKSLPSLPSCICERSVLLSEVYLGILTRFCWKYRSQLSHQSIWFLLTIGRRNLILRALWNQTCCSSHVHFLPYSHLLALLHKVPAR